MSKTKEKEIISPFKKVVSKIAKKERDNEIAKNMLRMNLDIKVISQATNLTIKEVEELKKTIEK